MRTHIKVVGLVNLLFSALGVLGALGIFFGGVFGSLATLNPIAFVVGSVTSLLVASIMGVVSLFGLIAGFALLNHRPWARVVILVVSVMRLFKWPWGTVFGAYSIWVLMSDETKQIFDSTP